jgi:hypothetical protein
VKAPHPVELIITELQRSGDGSFEGTPVVFRWSSAEHASTQGDVSMHLQVKTNRREIPGSNKVVEHAMSATWQPFELNGEWDDKWGNRRFPSNGTLVRTGAYALEMFREFATMITRMPLVRVELDALSYVGLITDLKIQYRTQTHIRWSATLSPHVNEIITVEKQRALIQQSLPRWVEDASDQINVLQLKLNSIKGLHSMPPVAFKTPQLDRFTTKMLEINDALDRMKGIVEDGFHTETEAKLLLMASTFRRMRGASKSVLEILRNSQPDENIGYGDALDEMRYKEWSSGSVEDLWKMIGFSRDAEMDVRRRAKQRPRAIYYPKAGESLERISMMFYGTADNWRAIYDKNNLDSLNLDGTEELVIPQRTS